MKIACFGYIEKEGGSCVGAHYLVLEELQKRGHEIDVFAWQKSDDLIELFKGSKSNLTLLNERSNQKDFIKKFMPNNLSGFFERNLGALFQNTFGYRYFADTLRKHIGKQFQQKTYDYLLYLGLYPPVKIDGLPVISWVQGPPQTEWYFLRRSRNSIIRYCGRYTYYKMAFFYMIKNRRTASQIKNSDLLICGSQWSKQQIINYGINPDAVQVLPYPVDLKTFSPKPLNLDTENTWETKEPQVITFLWLGRIDPRKRFDLMIEAYLLLLKERKNVNLKIAGRFRFAGYKQLFDNFPFPENIEYIARVQHEKIPELIKSCDILIQTSEGENLGTSIAESLCCGTPAILGPTNGTQDFIGSSSFVFKEYSPVSIKETMFLAMEKIEASRSQEALKARQAAEQHFSTVRVGNQLEQIFRESIKVPLD